MEFFNQKLKWLYLAPVFEQKSMWSFNITSFARYSLKWFSFCRAVICLFLCLTQRKSKTIITRRMYVISLIVFTDNYYGHRIINYIVNYRVNKLALYIIFILVPNTFLCSHKFLFTLKLSSLFFGALFLCWHKHKNRMPKIPPGIFVQCFSCMIFYTTNVLMETTSFCQFICVLSFFLSHSFCVWKTFFLPVYLCNAFLFACSEDLLFQLILSFSFVCLSRCFGDFLSLESTPKQAEKLFPHQCSISK